ncbi:aminofutalosine synthase MqnE [Campylobacter sp. RM9939]|uniref:aminofutalosine synthase MqnE n=1 Tax=Campylobacter molothri TaxID=1032242 RepID=UPI001D312275|nr:aminofutalosine synthase MqnE [Campylobacter sp. W0065]MBZ7937805.1 aminofutalosine synthase MqnE [Campylobacter sp. RM10538]MBZ7946767.1 aminofutalosine synthase MqnE [Campylobacter sp. RM10536]MBZ7952748.1 aminofutalosine synthase MqnE [Campylobacter sp. RM9939]MBZ7955558.1 aminofutalosine synthase MqnE [Campylobacter sp. RM17709]MBZ7957007.1 aminofutalosine synthase MqnE [Campylobacter sp. RM10541]MBZ7962864.1 aminofutalosine synthase MqnE [Campylobacter sp. W0049]MBZ7966061.1 aminofut
MKNLIKKLENEERINQEEANRLWDLDLFTLGKLAHKRREKFHGKKVYFNINRHINPTNICADTCKFCAFSAHRKNPNPYIMTHDEIMKIVDETVTRGTKEVHIVSAHNKDTSWQWYLEIFKMIKEKYPYIHIKAMTAAEIDFLHRRFAMSYEEVIEKMLEYGVDSMPGGGAEIFDEEIRKKICHGKVSSENWLKIHKLWHKKGKQSNATMLFGHIEERKHRIDHMFRLRNLQDETGGFNAFIPLVWQRNNSFIQTDKIMDSEEILKTVAISRLVLDNIKNIKAYWATMTLNLAMVAQEFGANDLDGTIEKESIQSAGGAKSAKGASLKTFIDMIKTANLIPVERDSLYNELKIY